MLKRLVLAGVLASAMVHAQTAPSDWIDPDTGHKIVRLSQEDGSASLYFHQNAYTHDGNSLVFTTPEGLSVLHLKTHQIKALAKGDVGKVVVGRKTPQVFYTIGDSLYATNVETGATRLIGTRKEFRSGSGFAVNADDTLLAGSYVEVSEPVAKAQANRLDDNPPSKGEMMERRLAARLPMALYTVEIETGKVNAFYHSTDWLNHVQFSPTDRTLVMFCHEGPWHKVDRIWTIRTDGSGLRKIHTRTIDMEIAGHEFFSADGETIWYDLQTPKGKEFWLAGFDLKTGKQTKYPVPRDEWSVHYNISPDGKFFAGDGGGPDSVAAPGNGKWIYLFTPAQGKLKTEKLVNLAKHNYRLEPNVTFTPDGKWIVFRSNMFGPTHIFAVEVSKAKPE